MKNRIKNLFLLPALILPIGLFTVDRVTAQTFTTLHSFTPTSPYTNSNNDGAYLYAGLITNSSGTTLYGTAYYGGSSSNGTVFAVNTDGTGFKVLHSFTPTSTNSSGVYTNSDGSNPVGGLVLSGNTLYGTAFYGGSSGKGTVFKVNTDGTGFRRVHNFIGGSDGASPAATLLLSGNTLYGTATQGGSGGDGTVFAVNTDGTGFKLRHSFTYSDGAYPYAGLLLSGDTLYGAANQGGSSAYGTVFAINTNGTGFRTLHSFTEASDPDLTNSDGAYPGGTLILSGNTLYGTAGRGGASGNGTVFAINTNGSGFTNLHSFTTGTANGNGYDTNGDGAYPNSGLILSGTTLYGTASQGGSGGIGTVFAINADGTCFTNLHSLKTESLSPPYFRTDGAYPHGGVILAGNTLYGTAILGGSAENGAVFAVNTDGASFTVLHSFIALSYTYDTNSDGTIPYAGLTVAGNGNTRYGTASLGGRAGYGTVFAVNTDGTGFTNIHSFNFNDGGTPWAALILSGNSLYGTTYSGGSSGNSTDFAINTDGTYSAANSGNGTVFAINTDGTGFTNLHTFTAHDVSNINGDGANPNAGLILSGGILYGTASLGGSSGVGTVFAVNIDGTGFTTLHSFNVLDGNGPVAGLVLSGDTLYGTTVYGGTENSGTVFRINTDATGFMTLHSFPQTHSTAGGGGGGGGGCPGCGYCAGYCGGG
jgi:uncharacterized repeat protein (TIGR03803 family)